MDSCQTHPVFRPALCEHGVTGDGRLIAFPREETVWEQRDRKIASARPVQHSDRPSPDVSALHVPEEREMSKAKYTTGTGEAMKIGCVMSQERLVVDRSVVCPFFHSFGLCVSQT